MSIRRDPRTGRWFFRAVLRHANGRRERIFGTPGVPGPYQDLAPTKIGAQEAERRAIAEAIAGKPAAAPPPPPVKEVPTIQSYSETFLEKYVPTLTKPSARRALRQTLVAHILPVFGKLRLDAIRQEHVDGFVGSEKKRGMSPKTINNRLSALSRLLRYARDNGHVAAPAVRLRCKVPGMSAEIAAVPLDHVEKLLAVATDERHRVAMLLATEAGLRAGEILGAQWTDIHDGQLTVNRALDKESGEIIAPKHNKRRKVPLSPRLIAALGAMRKRGLWIVGRLDGGPLGYYGLHEAIAALYDRAQVPRPAKPIHCLRHSFGTVMAARGVPLPVLQELMGHSEVSTTRRYITVGDDQKRAAIAMAWQPRGSEQVDDHQKRDAIVTAWQPRGSESLQEAKNPRKC